MSVQGSAFAVTSLEVTGRGAIDEANLAMAEKLALEDAFSKAIFLRAQEYVPESSFYALARALPDYISARGMQDITRYKITSRSTQFDMLNLDVSLNIDDEPLKQWLYQRALTSPRELRPKILLMISSIGTGDEDVHEWWKMRKKPSYSSFESTLADELHKWGENIVTKPARPRGSVSNIQDPVEIARKMGVDFLVSGTITYTPVIDTLYECTLDVRITDLDTMEVSPWSVSYRGDFPVNVMNSLIVTNVVTDPARSLVSNKIRRASPVVLTRTLCIENIDNYLTYQSIINSLNAMDGVNDIGITGIKQHQICHSMKLRGNIEDVLDNLKREQIADIDIEIRDDTATVRLLPQKG